MKLNKVTSGDYELLSETGLLIGWIQKIQNIWHFTPTVNGPINCAELVRLLATLP